MEAYTHSNVRLSMCTTNYALMRLAMYQMWPHVPANWPELADFEFRMGELWEIGGMVVVQGIVAPSELESLANDGLIQVPSGVESGQEVGSYVVREHALRCFENCLYMRRVAYGEEHSRKRLTAALPETLQNAVLVAGLAGGIQAGVLKSFFSTILRKSAGFAVFFLIFDALKAKLAATTTPASKAARAAQNLAAVTLAATWNRCREVFGGRKGGNRYAAALEQITGSALKAAVPLVAMDLVLGRPSW
ncbi:hypothetical protein CcCBS67573_g07877 [Chytriomyces confervae]|uniref:Uncharacterized protein n=1 Tax=Chytriomyces confervae TaxID=246404 RepID=A0A507ET11_9FUNG|nr:hypothetical protein CcCBS67573_g07877 [Chytriomyces confervae]